MVLIFQKFGMSRCKKRYDEYFLVYNQPPYNLISDMCYYSLDYELFNGYNKALHISWGIKWMG